MNVQCKIKMNEQEYKKQQMHTESVSKYCNCEYLDTRKKNKGAN